MIRLPGSFLFQKDGRQTRWQWSLFRSLALCAAVGFTTVLSLAAPSSQRTGAKPPPDPEALRLVRELLSQKPEEEVSLEGVFKIRRSNGRRSEVPVEYFVRLADPGWQSVYRAAPTQTQGAEELIVLHQIDQPNRYRFTQISLDNSRTNVLELVGSEAAASFAGTDFWLSDLGMEFLHWPEQRLIRDAKIRMRLGRPCHVLESRNPTPAQGTYARVVSWIDTESGGLIRAEAYDVFNKRYKVFTPKGFEKVDGRWQVKGLEMQNEKTDSKTQLEFSLRQ